jgi:hypothetical protein
VKDPEEKEARGEEGARGKRIREHERSGDGDGGMQRGE